MPQCATCDEGFPTESEWLTLTHHYPHMTFDSTFCSVACARAYLDGRLERPVEGE